MKLLFVDLIYHSSTKSSHFMIELLKNHFEVDVIYIEPRIEGAVKLLGKNFLGYDIVVLWQIDWLAPFFLRNNIKTVVVPMFDGSSTLESTHWRVAKDALFINFSLNLHCLITNAGCESLYVKYFPPKNKTQVTSSVVEKIREKPSAFFWERRPDTHINTKEVSRMLDGAISHLHIHQAPDIGLTPTPVASDLSFSVSTSTWFERPDEYLSCVCSHELYIAPRYTEGIGMGFLEAMALGRVVVAHDAPTHNEYIKNGYNGILFDAFRGDVLSISTKTIHDIGLNASFDSIEMRDAWENNYAPLIIKRIQSYAKSGSKNTTTLTLHFSDHELLFGLMSAHIDWNIYYSTLNSLEKACLPGSAMNNCIGNIVCELEKIKNYDAAIDLLKEKIAIYGKYSPYGLMLNQLTDRSLIKSRHLG